MALLSLGPTQRFERRPENGDATFLVGDPETLWQDDADATYSDTHGTGFTTTWGVPYAEVPGLTLSAESAAGVDEITVRYRVRCILAPGSVDPVMVPLLDVGPPNDAWVVGGGNQPVGAYEWWHGDGERFIVTPEFQWVETVMAFDNWASPQEFLTDPRLKYVFLYIDAAHADDHFQVAEVQVSGPGLYRPPPRRVFPRDDGLTGGAPRVFPASKGLQSGNRTVGGYL